MYHVCIFAHLQLKSNRQNTCFALSPTGARFTKEEGIMSETLYSLSAGALSDAHKRLSPEPYDAFQQFSRRVFANGALTTKTKQLIAVAVAHVTQCPYCIRGHTKAAMREGATHEELMEAVWVAAEMRAGAAYAHSLLALDEIEKARPPLPSENVVAADR
jgi:AhpD family alkylhydroperoxidase